MHALDASRGKFARVCIEINLDEPVVGKVWFRDFWYHIEYEGLHLLCKSCGLYGHVARNCTVKATEKEKAITITTGGGTPEMTSNVKKSSTNSPNLDGGDTVAEIKGEDMYGDWLVVNRKKNQGRTSRPKTQVDPAKFQGGVPNKSHVKDLQFSILNNAGTLNVEEAKQQAWAPQFHPGGLFDSPKVWIKQNKRVRGMSTFNREPNKEYSAGQSSKPNGKGVTHNKSPILDIGNRVGSVTPNKLVPHTKFQNNHEAVIFLASRNENQSPPSVQTHLKPPEPNGKSTQAIDSSDREGDDDEMVVETPSARQ
jgi:hypothetical protein